MYTILHNKSKIDMRLILGHCDCPLGYIGERCERDACEIIDCGEYSSDCEAGHCSCMSGYEGSWCDQLICDRIQCYHGSTCNLGRHIPLLIILLIHITEFFH